MAKKTFISNDPGGLVCPECGQLMDGIDPVGHALSHWPEHLEPNKSNQTARERQVQCLKGGVTQIEYNDRISEEA